MKTARDHEVKYEPEIAIHTNGDALADAAKFADGFAFGAGEGRIDGAEEEGAGEAHAFKRLAEDARFERGDIGGDVGQFRH